MQIDGCYCQVVTIHLPEPWECLQHLLEETSPDGVTKTRMTAPDITCYINTDTCAPLSNADIVGKNGEILVKNVAVGVMKVDEKWWRSDLAYLQKIWTRYFKILGKPDQQIVKYE